MTISLILDYLFISAIASVAISLWISNFAKSKKILIDLPDKSRKFHKRATPLTGGISILIATIFSGKLYIDLNNLSEFMPNFTLQLIYSSVFLVIFFLIDDIKGLKPVARMFFQAILCLYIIKSTGVELESLGDLFGNGEIRLGYFSTPITIFAVVGVMNAFNMLDGINGLCSGFCMLALLITGFFSGLMYDSMLVIIVGSLIGFLLFNLRIFGAKRTVFLGDHGSNLMGFWVAWIAIYVSQSEIYNINPITMVWIIAIPLLDCIGLILYRTLKGSGWTTPGRDHIHHKLMNYFSSERTLFVILFASGLIMTLAILLQIYFIEYISFYLFILFGLFYYYFSYRLINRDTDV